MKVRDKVQVVACIKILLDTWRKILSRSLTHLVVTYNEMKLDINIFADPLCPYLDDTITVFMEVHTHPGYHGE